MGEITVILLLALIFLGPKKLPELASGLGKLIREIRKTTADVKNEIQLDDAIRKPFEELREAVTLHPEELKRRDKLRKELAELQRQAEAAVAAAEAVDRRSGARATCRPPRITTLTALGANSLAASPAPARWRDPQVTGQASPPWPISRRPRCPLSASPCQVPRPRHGCARLPRGRYQLRGAGLQVPAPPAPPWPRFWRRGRAPSVARTTVEPRCRRPPARTSSVRCAPSRKDSPARAGWTASLTRIRGAPSQRTSQIERRQRTKSAGSRTPVRRPASWRPDPSSAADRNNTTQALTEADLAAITIKPPPPPPPASVRRRSPVLATCRPPLHTPPLLAAPARLPGATPPKNSNR